ncbi:MAG TPA: DUF6599 family protein [Polyangiaceae bacterium]
MRPALVFVSALAVLSGCSKPDAGPTPPPPPPATTPSAGGADVCASGGGTDSDAISAPFFPRTVGTFCLDPQGDVKTYGEQGKLTMDDVCTTAFDGECEVYKTFGLKRVVAIRYVDAKGSSVEINLSRFGNDDGAYGMYTKRVVADGDPADSHAPRAFDAQGAGAMGSGRAYVWRGSYLVELTYLNESETPGDMIKSSEKILPQVGKAIGEKLTGATDKPASAKALPATNMLPNAIAYFPDNYLALGKIGPAAVGFYKDGAKRYRLIAMQEADVDHAKDIMKTLKGKQGALPVASLGDEAVLVALPDPPDADAKNEFVFTRKGSLIEGAGGEPLTATDATTKATKDEKTSKLRAWLNSSGAATPAPSSSTK